MGLCRRDSGHHGSVHLVHRPNYGVAVSPLISYTVQPTYPPTHRTQFRKEANAADNKGATVSVDSLINFEAVKVNTIWFNPPPFVPICGLRIVS